MCFVSPENKSLSVAKKSINDFPNKDLKEALTIANKLNITEIMLQPDSTIVNTEDELTVNDNTTAMWVVNTPATDTTSHKNPSHGNIMLPGTGIRANTSLKVTNAVVTHVTVYYG